MTIMETLTQAIIEERQRREASAATDLLSLVENDEIQEAVEGLIFFATPSSFSSRMATLEQEIKARFAAADEVGRERYLHFLADLTLALRSFLPRWNLQNKSRHGETALVDAEIAARANKVRALGGELENRSSDAARRLLKLWREEAAARLNAEAAADPKKEAAALVGDSVGQYLDNISAELACSNLRRISEMRDAGQTPTELSNDYAAFLQYALYLGVSFATTNPPLVDLAWLADLDRWNPIVDAIIHDNPDNTADELARLVTLEFVLANMRLLRPIFLITEGRMGCVCLQVNPHKHDDAEHMICDALFLYEQLRDRLGGGVPNVVFKLPGTKAGLEACYALTRRGIGVTITVDFGMFQHIPFAQAMEQGQAIFSCLVEMNGRLAFPVRDELLARLGELAVYGVDEAKAREAAAWAGVAVIKRLYRSLTEKGYDTGRFKPLIASLRIYEGAGYEGLPSAFPDVTETIGSSLISVFPNVRRAFDAREGLKLHPLRIEDPVPEDILDVLAHSEIFRQAYFVADRYWVPAEDGRFRPERELTLNDEANVFAWRPVHDTQTGFIQSYDTFVERILERKRLMKLSRRDKKHTGEHTMTRFETARTLLGEFKGDAYLHGIGVLSQAGSKAAKVGKRIALVRDTFPGAAGFVATIKASLADAGGDLVGEIDGAAPNAPREDLSRITDRLTDLKPDVVISFGGGSTIDAAKAAIVLSTLSGDIEDYFGTGLVTQAIQERDMELTTHMAIQTAASSGAHLTKYSNITDVTTGQKKLIVDQAIVPDLPVFDYGVTFNAPRSLTIDGALDGIAHSLEVLYGAVGTSNYDKIEQVSGESISLVVQHLPKVMEEPEDASGREALGLATDLGGYAIMLGGTNGGHLTSFSLVDVLSHGRACAIMNPYYTVFFSPTIEPALKAVGKIYQDAGYTDAEIDTLSGRELGVAVALGMIAFQQDIGFPTTLGEVEGFTDGHIERALAAAKNPQLKMKLENMPVPLTAEMIDDYMGPILEAARDGDLSRIRNV